MDRSHSSRRLRALGALGLAHLIALSLACGASGEATDEPDEPAAEAEEETLQIVAVRYGRALSAEGSVVEPVEVFVPTDSPIHLTVTVAGRPTGVMTFTTDYYGAAIVNTVDLSAVNAGVVWSAGQNTFATNTLTSNSGTFYQGEYETVVTHGDRELGRYPFRVGPPADAIPSTLANIHLYSGIDDAACGVGEPQTTFAPGQAVMVGGRGDLGNLTWIEAHWSRGDEELQVTGQDMVVQQNAPDTCVAFASPPWEEPGAYSVRLLMNGEVLGTFPFTVAPPG